MARIDHGNNLSGYIIQPGWSVNIDSYGLATSSVTFKVQDSVDKETPLVVGQAHPDSAFSYMKAHKSSSKYDRNGIATVTVDYVGIVNRTTTQTIPQLFATSSLASEPLTTHPNFFTEASGYGSVIAGTAYDLDSTPGVGPVVKKIGSDGKVTASPCWIGTHGAAFETESGGRFIGFVNNDFPEFYGKTNYLTPNANFNGIVYTESETDVQSFNLMIGVAANEGTWNNALPNLIPSYMGTVFKAAGTNYSQLLLSQASTEVFSGAIYKVSFEIKFSKVGWHPSVYLNANA